jgi:hypothetical protein
MPLKSKLIQGSTTKNSRNATLQVTTAVVFRRLLKKKCPLNFRSRGITCKFEARWSDQLTSHYSFYYLGLLLALDVQARDTARLNA